MRVHGLFVVMLALATCAGRAATPTGDGREPMPTPWRSEESYPGKAQYDPRLDKTVFLWGAGMPLATAFSQITAQTGVQLSFWPAGDMNARVCVNLYLNSKRAPTLRELMAQLAWVTDCEFAYARNETGELTYFLLGTSVGPGALVELTARWRDASRRRGELMEQRGEEARQKAFSRLSELREAMRLRRSQAIKRYKGVDDGMLLALLDPGRRKVAELLLTLPEQQMRTLESGGFSQPWDKWSPEQQALLKEAMQPFLERQRRLAAEGGEDPGAHWDDWNWILAKPVEVSVQSNPGAMGLSAWRWDQSTDGDEQRGIEFPPIELASNPWDPGATARTGIELRRALGEEISDSEAEQLEMEAYDRQAEAEARQRFEANVARCRMLTKEAEARLGSLKLSVKGGASFSLWQAQEAAAALSGMSVVSDCFWQPQSRPKSAGEAPPAQDQQVVSALELLTASAISDIEGDTLLPYGNGHPPGWGWGDAGDFLRFRSVHRQVWREAFLPEGARRKMEGWVEACLPDEASMAARSPVNVPVEVREWGRLWRGLTRAQRLWGGRLIYGDPADMRNAYRQAFLGEMCRAGRIGEMGLELLGRLSDEQWETARGAGLRIGIDFPEESLPGRFRVGRRWQDRGELRLQVVDPSQAERGAGGGDTNADVWLVQLVAADGPWYGWRVPRKVTVQPPDSSALLANGKAAGQEEGHGQAEAE